MNQESRTVRVASSFGVVVSSRPRSFSEISRHVAIVNSRYGSDVRAVGRDMSVAAKNAERKHVSGSH